jgi:hypothetical protein
VALVLQWRQDYLNNRPPTWATVISAVGQKLTHALQQNNPSSLHTTTVSTERHSDAAARRGCREVVSIVLAENGCFRMSAALSRSNL